MFAVMHLDTCAARHPEWHPMPTSALAVAWCGDSFAAMTDDGIIVGRELDDVRTYSVAPAQTRAGAGTVSWSPPDCARVALAVLDIPSGRATDFGEISNTYPRPAHRVVSLRPHVHRAVDRPRDVEVRTGDVERLPGWSSSFARTSDDELWRVSGGLDRWHGGQQGILGGAAFDQLVFGRAATPRCSSVEKVGASSAAIRTPASAGPSDPAWIG
jgi:hypothetical protein